MFFILNTNTGFLPFLLYVRCKSGVTFIRRSFRDVKVMIVFDTETNLIVWKKMLL